MKKFEVDRYDDGEGSWVTGVAAVDTKAEADAYIAGQPAGEYRVFPW